MSKEDYTLGAVARLIKELLQEGEDSSQKIKPREVNYKPRPKTPNASRSRGTLLAVQQLYERQRQRDNKVQVMRNKFESQEVVKPFRVNNPITAIINEHHKLKPIEQRVSQILKDKEKKLLRMRISRQQLQNSNYEKPFNQNVSLEFVDDTDSWYERKVKYRQSSKERKLQEERLKKADQALRQLKLRPQINSATVDHQNNYLRRHKLQECDVVERLSKQRQRSIKYKKRIKQQLIKQQTPFKPKLNRRKSASNLSPTRSNRSKRSPFRLNTSVFDEGNRQHSVEKHKKITNSYQPNQQLYRRLQREKEQKIAKLLASSSIFSNSKDASFQYRAILTDQNLHKQLGKSLLSRQTKDNTQKESRLTKQLRTKDVSPLKYSQKVQKQVKRGGNPYEKKLQNLLLRNKEKVLGLVEQLLNRQKKTKLKGK